MTISKISKTVVAALAITFTLNVVAPQKSEAGVLFYAVGRTNKDLTVDAQRGFQIWGIILMVVGIATNSWGWFLCDTNANEDGISKQLQTKFKTLTDQPNVANKLGKALSAKATALFKENPTATQLSATLTVSEADAILTELVVTKDNISEVAALRTALIK